MEPVQYAQQVGRNVAAAIEAADLSRNAVAKATGIAPATLSRRLSGNGKSLDVVELKIIADLVEVPVESFVAVP